MEGKIYFTGNKEGKFHSVIKWERKFLGLAWLWNFLVDSQEVAKTREKKVLWYDNSQSGQSVVPQ